MYHQLHHFYTITFLALDETTPRHRDYVRPADGKDHTPVDSIRRMRGGNSLVLTFMYDVCRLPQHHEVW